MDRHDFRGVRVGETVSYQTLEWSRVQETDVCVGWSLSRVVTLQKVHSY